MVGILLSLCLFRLSVFLFVCVSVCCQLNKQLFNRKKYIVSIYARLIAAFQITSFYHHLDYNNVLGVASNM